MNREIKFRAWILSPKEDWTGVDNFDEFDWDNRMRVVSSIHFPLNKYSGKDITCDAICKNDNYASGWFGASYKDFSSLPTDVEYALMQFTGLKDKDGNDIYEGDILLFEDNQNNEIFKFKVEFSDGDFWSWEESIQAEKCQIIGNIYETPELLGTS